MVTDLLILTIHTLLCCDIFVPTKRNKTFQVFVVVLASFCTLYLCGDIFFIFFA